MILQPSIIIIAIILNFLPDLVSAISQTSYGGQGCPSGCVQSFSCATRCAPVTLDQTGPSILRWCISSSSTSDL